MEMHLEMEQFNDSNPGSTNEMDWGDAWYQQMMKRQGIAPDCCMLWPEKEHAQYYWDTLQSTGKERMEAIVNEFPVESTSRVLDIGAGPGTMAVPLASRVSHITTVEPSAGMRDVLLENAFTWGVSNITCVPKMWEHVDVDVDLSPPYDIVIASFSLEMPRIDIAVQKMMDVCSGWIYLFWFAGEPTWTCHYKSLWPELHGKEYEPTPKFDLLIRVLQQMGIFPHVEITPVSYPIAFSSS